jgi:hypothetical protein
MKIRFAVELLHADTRTEKAKLIEAFLQILVAHAPKKDGS